MKKEIFALILLGILSFAGCQSAVTLDQAKTQAIMPSNETAMPGELSTQEAARYTSTLPLDTKLKLAEELAMKMPKNGMKQIMALFPDMKKVREIKNDDQENILKMGPETWYFSQEGNITVSACSATNGPIHVFQGKNPSIGEISKAAAMIHEMGQSDKEGTMMNQKPTYINYSDGYYNSLLGKKPFALFFHASWCPTCRQMEHDIKGDLDSFPAGTVIVQTDYDTMTDLKKTYGIVTQSTVVILNAQGKVTATLVAPDNETLKEAIKKSLM